MSPAYLAILAQLEAEEGEPEPHAPCGCPLREGPESEHRFGCSWGRRGPVLRVVAVREIGGAA